MNKNDIQNKFSEIDNKFAQLSDFQAKLGEIESARQKAEENKNASQSVVDEIIVIKGILDPISQTIENRSAEVDLQKNELTELKEKTKKLVSQNEKLVTEIKNHLGFVNAESLANSFGDEAKEHGEEYKRLFRWVFWSTITLIIISIGIVLWEYFTSNAFLNSNFLIKTVITSPFIFFLVFIVKQYGQEKRLCEEYSFKAAVARSFEAYRKLIREEVSQDSEHNIKALEFFISSINNIYSNPCNAISERDSASIDSGDINLFGKLAGVFKGIFK